LIRYKRSGAAAVVLGLCVAAAIGAQGAVGGNFTCSGTFDNPGQLSGTIKGNVQVTGACVVDEGPTVVRGNLTVGQGATLAAIFGLENSTLTVHGNLTVQKDGTAVIGCNPESSSCADDNQDNPVFTVTIDITGNLTANQALGVVSHNTTVGGNIDQHGGGGGFTCDTSPGIFALFGSPVFTTYEDGSVGGNVNVTNVNSCWMGLARMAVHGNAAYMNNQMADPDAIEIVSNDIHGNLSCRGNSMTWDSGEEGPDIFPRFPQPNTVGGNRSGQCYYATPLTDGGPSGPPNSF
jgi:cytoskeletal protein CcmA (bactofilin family)